jgi:hypothetical protein
VAVELGAHVVIKAVDFAGDLHRVRVAKQDAELPAHLRERLAHEVAVSERPEVARAVILAQAGEHKARQLGLEAHAHEQEPLVVGEVSVVPRLVLLDEAPLQQQRLRLAPHLNDIEAGDHLDQRPDLGLLADIP